jgi:hypothetical protein
MYAYMKQHISCSVLIQTTHTYQCFCMVNPMAIGYRAIHTHDSNSIYTIENYGVGVTTGSMLNINL